MKEWEDFYLATKYQAGDLTRYEPFPDAPLATVDLPRPKGPSRATLVTALANRRSRRKLARQTISLDELSFLLWASDGISRPGLQPQFRTAPSAGARHPLETYFVALRVEGLENGLYRFDVPENAVEMYRRGDLEEEIVKATAGQEWLRGAAVAFAWVAEFARTTARYKGRGYRYVLLDAGHVCQNLYLGVEALGLGMTAIAAFSDDEANALLGLDGRERAVVYMAGVGRPE